MYRLMGLKILSAENTVLSDAGLHPRVFSKTVLQEK